MSHAAACVQAKEVLAQAADVFGHAYMEMSVQQQPPGSGHPS